MREREADRERGGGFLYVIMLLSTTPYYVLELLESILIALFEYLFTLSKNMYLMLAFSSMY
jgi:hypothetical protein